MSLHLNKRHGDLNLLNDFRENYRQMNILLKKIHMSDKCYIYLLELVNKQNFRFWVADNLRNELVNESPRSVFKGMVAIGWDGIIGPSF